MKIEKTFLKSKVAQRIASLFVLCALLPIATLAILSFNKVSKHLREQSLIRLNQTSKTMSMAIYERLLFLEADMIRMASTTAISAENEYQKDRFRGIMVYTYSEEPVSLYGNISHNFKLDPEEKSILLEGESLIRTHFQDDGTPQIFLSRAVNTNSAEQIFLLAEVDPFYLWFMGYETSLPAMTEILVLDHDNKLLFSTFQSSTKPMEKISTHMLRSTSGQFDWTLEGKDYLASHREIFLQSKFQTHSWIIIASESENFIFSPIENFKKTFFLILILTLWIVIFLSFNQIRRSLIPLEKLKDGAQRIAKKDFSTKVVITSRDEFADLANAFNSMATRLGRQFKTLKTIAEIDRAILSALKAEDIVTNLLKKIKEVFPCDAVGVILLEKKDPRKGRIYLRDKNPVTRNNKKTLILTENELKELSRHPKNIFLDGKPFSQSYLVPIAHNSIQSFRIFPVFLQTTLAGIISFGYRQRPNLAKEDLTQARRLADQVGVALSNARLIEELSDFSWSTLKALARAIDAKSPWTSGHSERVTKHGMEIGKEMGLSRKDLEILKRGGLLHDIGKLGIPNKILEKRTKLTEKEVQLIKKHPSMGARILEPISAYTDTIHIVLQHHENYDGTGYPDGLAGEKISKYSRICAVADRFEALTADRPYRKAVYFEDAIKFIKDNSGSQFDPHVVKAFLRLMEKKHDVHLMTNSGQSTEFSARSLK